MKSSVLIIELVSGNLAGTLSAIGYNVTVTRGLNEATAILSRNEFQLIISRIFPSPRAWYSFLSKVRYHSFSRNVPVLLDASAIHLWPQFHDAETAGVQAILPLASDQELAREAIKHIPSEEISKSFFGNEKLMDAIHTENEEQLKFLQSRIRELDKSNVLLRDLLASEKDKSGFLKSQLSGSTDVELEINDQPELRQDSIVIENYGASYVDDNTEHRSRNLEILFSNTREGILILDSDGNIFFFNKTFREFIAQGTGRPPKLGQPLWEITVPERQEKSKELFYNALKGKKYDVEVRVTTGSGELYYQLNYSPVKIDGEIRFVTVILTDITARKKNEEKLKNSEANLRAIFNNTIDGFALLDADLKILAFNDHNYQNVLELTGKELKVGNSIFDTLPPERVNGFRALIQKVREEEVVRSTSHYKTAQGSKWFDIHIRAVRNELDEITGFAITSHNSTEIKKAEFEIIRLNKWLLNFQNAIQRSSIVSIADKKGNITFVNENFLTISGYSYEELIGKNHRVVNSGYHPKSFWRNMWQTITRGEIWRNRVKNKAKNGSLYWVDTFIMPFKDEEGNIVQYLSIRNDITSIKTAEEELLQNKLLLQQASRISGVGYYVVDQLTRTITPSPELLELFNLTNEEFVLITNGMLEGRHSGLRKIFDVNTLLGTDETSEEIKVIQPDGSIRWYYRRSKFTMVIDNEEKIIGTIQEITDQKSTEERLRKYNERFEILSQATNDAIWDVDLREDVISWSHAIRTKFGYQEKSLQKSRSWWESRIHPEDKERVLSSFGEAVSSKHNSWSAVYRFLAEDGSTKYVSNRASIILDDGNPVRAIGAIQDITESMKATEEIHKLSLVASKTNSGVMITDAHGCIEWVNESFSRISGYRLEEVKGERITVMQGPETDEATVKRISERMRRRQPVSEEIIHYTKAGEKLWIKFEISPVFDERGVLRNFISIQTNITELKEYELSITAIAEELSTLIENANVPIFGIDVDGKINEWNNVCSELFEFSRDAVLGRPYSDVFRGSGSSDGLATVAGVALKNRSVSNFELPLVTKSGKNVILLISASPRRSRDRQTTGAIFVGQNITELIDYRLNLERKVEERTRELHAALSKEQELVKLKNQFVSIASHEFRTPLSTIALAAGFIKRYEDRIPKEVIDEKVLSIERQVSHMTSLLDDILVVGKAEAGRLPVNLQPMEVSSFFRVVATEVERALGSTHKIVIEEDLKYREIVSDEKLLRNIVVNLFTNAIKFSPAADRVDVTIKTHLDQLDLIIADYGMGIPVHEIENIFEPFFRGGNVHSIHGTGLGLSIIRKATELLHGRIQVQSKPGQGTTFHVTLPI